VLVTLKYYGDKRAAASDLYKKFGRKKTKKKKPNEKSKPREYKRVSSLKWNISYEDIEDDVFWYVADIVKGNPKWKISGIKMMRLLSDVGFLIHFVAADEPKQLFFKKNNLVRPASPDYLLQFLKEYLKSAPPVNTIFEEEVFSSDPQHISEIFLQGASRHLDDAKLNFLNTIDDMNYIRDTKEICYFCFDNKAIEVTQKGWKYIDYEKLPGTVSTKKTIEAEIKDTITQADADGGEFAKFCKLVSSSREEQQDIDTETGEIISTKEIWILNEEKFFSLKTCFGYLLHRYRDRSKSKYIYATDETLKNLSEASGGTGKMIVRQALGHLRNVTEIDGSNWDPSGPFATEQINEDTEIVVIDEFDFTRVEEKKLFNMISEGVTIAKKYKDKKQLAFEDSPKMYIASNTEPMNHGASSRRRRVGLEFSDYFGEDHTPYDEFGHNLFADWSDEEWQYFYHFMFHCVQLYLSNGGPHEAQLQNMIKKHAIRATSSEFVDYFLNHIPFDTPISAADIAKNYNQLNGFRKDNALDSRTCGQWISKLIQIYRLRYEKLRQMTEGKQSHTWIIRPEGTQLEGNADIQAHGERS